MTAFSYSASTVKCGRGAAQASYIARTGQYASGRATSREDLVATGYGNLPPGFEDADEFWAAADAHTRADGRIADVRILTLPRGLDAAQQERAAMRFANRWCGEDRAYTWAIHNPLACDGEEQPHIHIMRSTKINDGIEREPSQFFRRYNAKNPERGGAQTSKGTAGQSRATRAAAMMAEREGWAEISNDALSAAGVLARVDARSNAARGLMREPEMKLRRDQRSDPEALAALHENRAAWKRAEEADARVTMLEEADRNRRAARAVEARLANAERPHVVPEAPKAAARTRQDRAAAVRTAKERHQVESQVEAQVTARVDAAKQPIHFAHDAMTKPSMTRQDRGAAVRAAKARHEAERQVEARVTAQVDAAKQPREVPQSAAAERAHKVGALATRAARADYEIKRDARQGIAAAQAEADQAAAAQQAKDAKAAQEAKEAQRRAEATKQALEARPTEAPAKAVGGGNKILKRVAGLFSKAVESVTTPAPVQPAKPIDAAPRPASAAPITVPPRPVSPAPVVRVTAAPAASRPVPAAPTASTTGAATPPVEKPRYSQEEAERRLRSGDVIQISKDGTAAVFRPSAAESAKGLPLPGVPWTSYEGLAGLEALLAREGVQPSRKEPARDGVGLVEYRISDLARLLSTKARNFASALIDRMQVATYVSSRRSEAEHGGAAPRETAAAPKATPSPAKKPRAPSRDRGGWERD